MAVIKICGLSRPEDIEAVNQARPEYAGFVIHFPKSHRHVTPEQVRQLRAGLADGIVPVGVIVNQSLETAAALLNEGIVDIVQLHGDEDASYIEALRQRTDRGQIWKAFKIRSREDLAAAAACPADGLVLDHGYGTGRMFDWSLLEGQDMGRPYLLAGGLTPENMRAALRQLRPWGVDLSSGVETNRRKDREKILAAVAAAHGRDRG